MKRDYTRSVVENLVAFELEVSVEFLARLDCEVSSGIETSPCARLCEIEADLLTFQ